MLKYSMLLHSFYVEIEKPCLSNSSRVMKGLRARRSHAPGCENLSLPGKRRGRREACHAENSKLPATHGAQGNVWKDILGGMAGCIILRSFKWEIDLRIGLERENSSFGSFNIAECTQCECNGAKNMTQCSAK